MICLKLTYSFVMPCIGITFGSIDIARKIFEGQFTLNGTTYYVEEAKRFFQSDGEMLGHTFLAHNVIQVSRQSLS